MMLDKTWCVSECDKPCDRHISNLKDNSKDEILSWGQLGVYCGKEKELWEKQKKESSNKK